MKTHLICWARNEADILEAHVRHHLRWASACTYVLHRCRDNSAEILERLKAEGLPVRYRTDERLHHEQAIVMTDLMRETVKDNADWILPLDADEFLSGDVASELAKALPDRPVSALVRNYVPMPGDSPDERCVLRRITHRKRSERPEWRKILVPRKVAEQSTLTFGNHSVRGADGMVVEPVPCALTIAHFPVRSDRQIRLKAYGGWLSHLSDPTRPGGATFQWKAVFDLCRRHERLAPRELTQLALGYASSDQWKSLPETFRQGGWVKEDEAAADTEVVRDPVAHDFALRYPVSSVDPMAVLLETAEAVAIECARASRENPRADAES